MDLDSRPIEAPSSAGADGSGEMFDVIAGRYDLLNRVLSLGLDRHWRRHAIAALGLSAGSRVLDLAAGTADLALEAVHQVPAIRVEGLDPSPQMLAVGSSKIAAAGLSSRIRLRRGDAQDLPYAEGSFDAVTMGFGIRNVPDRQRALLEIKRVLVPGGRVAILELGEPRWGFLGRLSRFHIHHLVPMIGGLLSGRRAYAYLEKSISSFPSASEFADQMSRTGLEVTTVQPLTFGVCHLFVAQRR